MVSLDWVRNWGIVWDYDGAGYITGLDAGQTIIRTHFGWSFSGGTADYAELFGGLNEGCFVGLVTTIGDGTEAVPNAQTGMADVSPPSQRWLWWEGRYCSFAGLPIADDLPGALFAQGPAQPTDSKAQVLAPTMDPGDTLNLWISYATTADFPVLAIPPYLQWWASCLVRTP